MELFAVALMLLVELLSWFGLCAACIGFYDFGGMWLAMPLAMGLFLFRYLARPLGLWPASKLLGIDETDSMTSVVGAGIGTFCTTAVALLLAAYPLSALYHPRMGWALGVWVAAFLAMLACGYVAAASSRRRRPPASAASPAPAAPH